jgi:fatty-acid peroxygenase
MVAVGWLGAFAALYLDETPTWRDRLATREVGDAHVAFAQEVRRATPFAPVLAGKVKTAATHDGVPLRRGDRVVLDVWGTDQSAQVWGDPETFRPERFLEREPGLYDLIPQGGGPPTGHRCPGEPLAVAVLAETVRLLALSDRVVASGHEVDLTRIPTLPPGGTRVRPRS